MLIPISNDYYPASTVGDFYTRLLTGANVALGVSTVFMLVTVLLSYPYAHYLPMTLQIVAHISTILAATVLKVSYVLRCVALNGLGKEVR
ncbi:hypothetical protein HH219_18025 [Pseudoalteromonas sp. NEC-BIFX-2020_015]|uniref:hypothetical protein n=1 Tax=Pseudoalteromonas sp. NEC-BIFX-2020_015 TaxID=2729544 RepID=UPI00146151F5|nr:hypothetical protein [Pseudoalteromonas sp. NEC-BIFX-2020_015]NMR27409.1 hypothetical protein [Pseudoalteromonas sp. NEC-BIFX-2020_015]